MAKKIAKEWVTVELYRAARAEAQAKADIAQCDAGIEKNDVFKRFMTFLLPRPENRTGYELRCEVVHPNEPRRV
jgi:hypothetical protein